MQWKKVQLRSCRQAPVFSLHSSFLLSKGRFGFSYRWFDISPTATAFVSSSIAMLNCLAHLSSDLCSICGCATTLRSYQLPLPKIVLNRDCKMQKKWSLKLQVGTSITNGIQLCVMFGKLGFSDCWLYISWPMASASNSTSASMQWWFCLS